MVALNVRVGEDLKRRLEAKARGQHRGVSEQARRYLELALIAEANPDLPFQFIEDILEAQAEARAGLVEPVDWSVESGAVHSPGSVEVQQAAPAVGQRRRRRAQHGAGGNSSGSPPR